MQIDYDRIRNHVLSTQSLVEKGEKDPWRNPQVSLVTVQGLQSHATAGKFSFSVDAAIDAGGLAQHPRPMDYLLGALAGCQQMWCVRWAALNHKTFQQLSIHVDDAFTWEGEYLERTSSAIQRIGVRYEVAADDISAQEIYAMADMVERRCPVFATLRRAAPIFETYVLNGRALPARQWQVGAAQAIPQESSAPGTPERAR